MWMWFGQMIDVDLKLKWNSEQGTVIKVTQESLTWLKRGTATCFIVPVSSQSSHPNGIEVLQTASLIALKVISQQEIQVHRAQRVNEKYKWRKGLVSKETVVLRRWGSSTQNSSDEGLTLETSAFRIPGRWSIYTINSVDNTKFFV